MMRFLICKKQCGEGCDYGIGCGMRYDFIEADSLADAQDKVVWPDGHDEQSALEGEWALTEILIVPAEAVTNVDVDALAAARMRELRDREVAEKEQRERAELARLQAKYSS